MLEHIVLLLGLAFLFLYFTFKLGEDHFILKLFFIFAFFFTILLVPYTTVEENCDLVIANQTVDGSVTLMEYKEVCDTTISAVELRTLKITNFVFWFFGIYFFVYIIYDLLMKRSVRFAKWVSNLRK